MGRTGVNGILLLIVCIMIGSSFFLSKVHLDSLNSLKLFRQSAFFSNEEEAQQRISQPNDKPVRIICLVSTIPKYHNTRVKAVMDTWGKRCDHIYFASSKDNNTYSHLNLVYPDVEESYENLYGKIKFLFKFAYDNFREKVDWFVKLDDDTFMIIENLKTYLADKNSSEPVVYGRNYDIPEVPLKQGFISGGAGYVLSRKALELVVQKAFTNESLCDKNNTGPEDVHMSRCMQNVGVRIGDAYDVTGEKFHPKDPQFSQRVPHPSFIKFSIHLPMPGLDCCSALTISFHYISPELMYTIEMLLYKIKVVDLTKIQIPRQELSHLLAESKKVTNRSEPAKGSSPAKGSAPAKGSTTTSKKP